MPHTGWKEMIISEKQILKLIDWAATLSSLISRRPEIVPQDPFYIDVQEFAAQINGLLNTIKNQQELKVIE